MAARMFVFAGGDIGPWRVVDVKTLAGDALADVERLNVVSAGAREVADCAKWRLRGVTSSERYIVRLEKERLVATQPDLGRPDATCAALIPIRKAASWWNLAQDERRRIFEESSHHVKIGLKYLPAVARRLHHCRDMGECEPFDFLTWFEYAPADAAAFNELVVRLRATEEWSYVDREIDIRVVRDGSDFSQRAATGAS